MSRITVAVVTARRLPHGMKDTPKLVRALAGCRLDARVVAWDDPRVDWTDFDLVLPHCTWDYREQHDRFLAWLREVDAQGTLVNPYHVLRRTFDKSYLLRLRQRGIAVPDLMVVEAAQVDPDDVEERLGSGPLVVKPAVSGRGRRVWRCASPAAACTVVRTQLPGERVVIQQFEPAIADGEYSAVFFDGELSHVVRRRPGTADGRGPQRLAPSVASIGAPPWIAAFGDRLLATLPQVPSYARVDFLLPAPATPLLMELQLVEPDLFLRHDQRSFMRLAYTLIERAEAGRPLPQLAPAAAGSVA